VLVAVFRLHTPVRGTRSTVTQTALFSDHTSTATFSVEKFRNNSVELGRTNPTYSNSVSENAEFTKIKATGEFHSRRAQTEALTGCSRDSSAPARSAARGSFDMIKIGEDSVYCKMAERDTVALDE
jgi:hypothetical protein